MEMFQEVAESQKKQEENEDASATAEALEKLSVGEEEKSTDKAPEEEASPVKETAASEEKVSPAKEIVAPAEETKAELKNDDVEKKSEDSSA